MKHRNNSKNNNGAGAMKRNCSMFIFVLAGLLCSPVSHAEKDYDDLSREEMKAIADKAQKAVKLRMRMVGKARKSPSMTR